MVLKHLVTTLALTVALGCTTSPQTTSTTTAASTGGTTVGSTGGTSGTSGTSGGGTTTGGTTGAPAAPYTLDPFDGGVTISSISTDPNYQRASGAIDLHDGPFSSVQLVVNLQSPCFPFSKWVNDPPPQGQNWPIYCDAYDRNFEFSLDDPGPDGGSPGLELERAITPFGGPEQFTVDMTDVANGLPGPHVLTVVIPTYSDSAGQVSGSHGTWEVSAQIQVTPGPAPRHVLAVQSLFYGPMTSTMTSATANVQVPDGTAYSLLAYRVTGHGGAEDDAGGCIGPAEEFCMRKHEIDVDGVQIVDILPWRTDCASLCTLTDAGAPFTYCLQNPCGDIQSVEAPRANWCPGSQTPPFIFQPSALAQPGSHDVRWTVSHIAAGGIWQTSVTYFAIGN